MDSIVEDAIEQAEVGDDEEVPAVEVSPSEVNPSGTKTDEELLDVLEELETNITVVGCGGGGNNTINRMYEESIHGAKLVAANTDVQHLVGVNANTKILMGQQRTKGLGAGSLPQVGEEAALESQTEIAEAIEGADMVFVTAGLGGGTGTGAAPVVAKTARESGALTISIVTTPFTAEGEVGYERPKNASMRRNRSSRKNRPRRSVSESRKKKRPAKRNAGGNQNHLKSSS